MLLKGNEIKEIEVDRSPKRHDYKLFGVGIDLPIVVLYRWTRTSRPDLGDQVVRPMCGSPESYHRRYRDKLRTAASGLTSME